MLGTRHRRLRCGWGRAFLRLRSRLRLDLRNGALAEKALKHFDDLARLVGERGNQCGNLFDQRVILLRYRVELGNARHRLNCSV
jgi:hypothetical protein